MQHGYDNNTKLREVIGEFKEIIYKKTHTYGSKMLAIIYSFSLPFHLLLLSPLFFIYLLHSIPHLILLSFHPFLFSAIYSLFSSSSYSFSFLTLHLLLLQVNIKIDFTQAGLRTSMPSNYLPVAKARTRSVQVSKTRKFGWETLLASLLVVSGQRAPHAISWAPRRWLNWPPCCPLLFFHQLGA